MNFATASDISNASVVAIYASAIITAKFLAAVVRPANHTMTTNMMITKVRDDLMDEQEQAVFESLAYLHPHEMSEWQPEYFWAYFHARFPEISREKMAELLDEAI